MIRPAAGSILTGFLLFFGTQILADLPLVFLERASGRELPAAGIFLTAAAAFAAFFFYKHHFRPAFQGNLMGNLKEGLLLSMPVLLYWAGSLLLALLTGHFAFKGVTPEIVRVSVSAGVLEELAWRLGVLATLLRRWDTKEQIVPAVIFSAAVFGLIHALNALAGADPLYTALQVAETACIGVFLGAVYVRSGSLASCMLIHILHDIFAISISPEVEAGGLVTGSVTNRMTNGVPSQWHFYVFTNVWWRSINTPSTNSSSSTGDGEEEGDEPEPVERVSVGGPNVAFATFLPPNMA